MICNKCKIDKDNSSFYRGYIAKSKYMCIDCDKLYQESKRRKNGSKPKVVKIVKEGTPLQCSRCKKDKQLADFSAYRLRNRQFWCAECDKEVNRARRRTDEHRKYHREYSQVWSKGEGRRKYVRDYERNRAKNDINYKISMRFSSAIWKVLKGKKSYIPWSDLVGYGVEELIKHLEGLFVDGMSWENYGHNGWHIDHIIPKSHFKYSDYNDEEFKRCWSLDNLQPLWAADNFKKRDKIIGVIK